MSILPFLKVGKLGMIAEGLGAETEAVESVAVEDQQLLSKGKTHLHHMFPQQFRNWFSKQGINNIDDFAIEISQSNHLKGIHGNGIGNMPGGWNQKWMNFIENNPNASPSEIFYHAEGMLRDFGIEHLPYIKYK